MFEWWRRHFFVGKFCFVKNVIYFSPKLLEFCWIRNFNTLNEERLLAFEEHKRDATCVQKSHLKNNEI